jgi:hypothetical protein
MANEVKWVYASQVTLEASGGSAASNVFVAADDTSLGSANHSNFPYADMVLVAGFGATVAAGGVVNLYRQDLDIDSTNDAPAPSTAYRSLFVGSFQVPTGGSATANYPLTNVPLSANCQFSVENVTGQNLSAGWALKATPKTYVPGS